MIYNYSLLVIFLRKIIILTINSLDGISWNTAPSSELYPS
jgi:hypothetical protein